MKWTFLLPLFLVPAVSFSGTAWQSNPLEQKAFVRNNGQFSTLPGSATPVLFGANSEGIEMFFTKLGLTYRHNEYKLLTKEERKTQGKEKGEECVSEKPVPHFLHITWEGANSSTVVEASDEVSYYYTYPDLSERASSKTIHASAYKKITYRNLYPNIDVEYLFPEGKPGIKYNIILHPGADPSVVKMKYEGARNISIDAKGNVVVQTSMGEFVDHAPQTFYVNDKKHIPSSFSLKDNIVSFAVSPSSPSERFGRAGTFPSSSFIVIDPWVTNPAYAGYNAAYDIEYDYAGNAYIYGGISPFKEIKLNNAGAIQWIYTSALFTVAGYYGDLAVDATSGTSYIVEPYAPGGTGARSLKVNTLGTQTGLFPGDNRIQEQWRIMYDNCNRKPIIGGSSFVNPGNYQAALLDTNMTGMTPVNVYNLTGSVSTPYNQDVCMMTQDNFNNCYFSVCGNMMAQSPALTLAPATYIVANNHNFLELSSVAYVMNNLPRTCGMNGMAASAKYVYTYDGGLIKRWNKNTGTFINGATLNATSFAWGGIAVDDCDNIFIGRNHMVVQMDTLFNPIDTLPGAVMGNDVYDVRIAPGNMLYACGKGFAMTYQLSLPPCGVSTMSVNATSVGSCSGQGSATVTVTGGSPPYSYSWNPGGQTTAVATGLFAGNYTVIVSSNAGCSPSVQTVTVNVTSGTSSLTVTSLQNNILCNGTPTGSATVTPTGGSGPLTYSWSPAGGAGPTATGLAAGTYTVMVTDSTGCSVPQLITLTQPSSVTVTATSTSTTCTSNSGTATANASGGTPGFTYSWNNGQTTPIISGLAAGSYSVLVTDANGCTKTQSVAVTSGGGVVVTATSTQTGCNGNTGTATASATSGTTPYTYSWSNGASTSIVTGLAAGNYSVTVYDASGCVQTQVVTVGTAAGPTATAAASASPITLGASTSLTATGGGSYQWNPSSGLSCDTCAGTNAAPTQTTEYCVTVTDANGCSDTACITIVVDVPCGTIYIPNAFSPNGDNENDFECVIGNCIESLRFTIYNRWGEVVFETTDQKICWDGSGGKALWYTDNPYNTAVFSYYLEAILNGSEKVIRQGNISLIR